MPISVIGQCPGTSCTYTITGADSGTYTINSGEKICFDTGADFTGQINLNDGEFINCASAPQSFVLWTGSSSIGTVNNYGTINFASDFTLNGLIVLDNYGTISIDGFLSLSVGTKYNNYDTTTTTANIIRRDEFVNNGTLTIGGSIGDLSSGILTNTGEVTATSYTVNGSFTNSGNITLTNGFTLGSSSTGTIIGGCISSSTFSASGTITGTTCGNILVSGGSILSSTGSLL